MATRAEIDKCERSLNFLSVVFAAMDPTFLNGWDNDARMTRREKIKRDLELIAQCDDPTIRARASEYLRRL